MAVEHEYRTHRECMGVTCRRCADLSLIETELVTQARAITNAKYECREIEFGVALSDARWRELAHRQ